MSANTSGVAAVIPDTDDVPVTPLLDINEVSCNCTNFPATDKVLLPPLDKTPEREKSLQLTVKNEDEHDAGSNEKSDDEHWFSDESEGGFYLCFLYCR